MTEKRFHLAFKSLRLARNDEVLLACSGGVDSIVLLDLLAQRGQKTLVCYVDHRQRKDTINDVSCIRRACKSLGFSFRVIRLKTAPGASESELRNLRYAALKTAARGRPILLAHHRDDQVETFLFKLLRGAHPETVKGMEARSERDGMVLIRPLLSFWKEEIVAYAHAHTLRWSEDSTNKSSQYSRNRIRNELLPLMEAIRRGSKEKVLEFFLELATHATGPILSDIESRTEKLRSSEGLQVVETDFQTLKGSIDQLLGKERVNTTKSHWKMLQRQFVLRSANPRATGLQKKVLFPGGNVVLFSKSHVFWNPPAV